MFNDEKQSDDHRQFLANDDLLHAVKENLKVIEDSSKCHLQCIQNVQSFFYKHFWELCPCGSLQFHNSHVAKLSIVLFIITPYYVWILRS